MDLEVRSPRWHNWVLCSRSHTAEIQVQVSALLPRALGPLLSLFLFLAEFNSLQVIPCWLSAGGLSATEGCPHSFSIFPPASRKDPHIKSSPTPSVWLPVSAISGLLFRAQALRSGPLRSSPFLKIHCVISHNITTRVRSHYIHRFQWFRPRHLPRPPSPFCLQQVMSSENFLEN